MDGAQKKKFTKLKIGNREKLGHMLIRLNLYFNLDKS